MVADNERWELQIVFLSVSWRQRLVGWLSALAVRMATSFREG